MSMHRHAIVMMPFEDGPLWVKDVGTTGPEFRARIVTHAHLGKAGYSRAGEMTTIRVGPHRVRLLWTGDDEQEAADRYLAELAAYILTKTGT